jgi:hypothetical protein
MASQVVQVAADALVAFANAQGFTAQTAWEKRDYADLPGAIVRLPRIERTDVEEAESELRSGLAGHETDWRMRFPVDLVFDLGEPIYAQNQAAEYVEKWILAVDTDVTLGGKVFEAKVVSSEPAFYEEQPRPTLMYETVVSLLKLV